MSSGKRELIRRTAQQIAKAAEAAEAAAKTVTAALTNDAALERWVRLVISQVAEVAASPRLVLVGGDDHE